MHASAKITESTLHAAADYAAEFLRGLDVRPVNATSDVESLRQLLDFPITADGMAPSEVISKLVEAVEGGLLGMQSGRFFGWVIGGALPSALAADWLTAAWGQNSALFASSPAASVVEEVAGRWLKEILGLPEAASFAFVTGCQMAHVTCLAAARDSLLRERGWDVEARGLHGAPRIRVLASAGAHASVARAIRLLGLGTYCLSALQPNEQEMLEAAQLEAALDEGDAPAIVILQAGEINTGAFENFTSLIPVAKMRNAWVHIDGAFGLWTTASPRYRYLTEGVALAVHGRRMGTSGSTFHSTAVTHSCGLQVCIARRCRSQLPILRQARVHAIRSIGTLSGLGAPAVLQRTPR